MGEAENNVGCERACRHQVEGTCHRPGGGRKVLKVSVMGYNGILYGE